MGRRGRSASLRGRLAEEGGKGISVADVMTAGAHGVPREITDGVVAGKTTRTTG